jgi:hypothetical protein
MAVDFGLMTGTMARVFVSVPPALTPRSCTCCTPPTRPSPTRTGMVHAADWRMFLMGPGDVQRELFRLHQQGRLRYEVAGSVAELRLPYPTAADYAHAELMA